MTTRLQIRIYAKVCSV